MEARTLNQIFQEEYKKNVHVQVYKKKWRDYWFDSWEHQIKVYHNLGFFLIRITNRCKRPYQGFKWGSESSLSVKEAMNHVSDGGNLAVVAGFSKPPLVLLDVDSHEVPPHLLDKTMTQISPRGFGIFLYGPYDDELFDKLQAIYKFFDTPRTDIMYSLLPLSVSCIHDTKDKHICERHDYRVREWIHEGPMISFKDYCQQVL